MDISQVKKTLSTTDCPFNWDVPDIEVAIDLYFNKQTEKCENIDDENEFQWTRFTLNLLLAYEFCDKKKDFTESMRHVESCVQHLDTLTTGGCKETLFCSLKTVLWHVTLATQAHILLTAGLTEKAAQVASLIKPLNKNSDKEKAGILGIQAAICIQYGTKGHRRSLEYATAARDLDPKQAEWYFIVGNSMGRLRRIENGMITPEEVNAIEKAFELHKDASYTVHLAQLYAEYSSYLFFNADTLSRKEGIDKSKIFAKQAVERYKEAIEIRPNCASIKARVAHGLLRIRSKEIQDIKYIKQLLDEVVKMTPNNAMVYHDLGLYYEKFENNKEKAISSLEKANELGNIKAFIYMIMLKWKHRKESQIINDLKAGLKKYTVEESQGEILAYLGASYLLIENDWPTGITYFNKCFELDSSAKILERFIGFRGIKTNMLELMTCELRSKIEKGENEPAFRTFLELSESVRPEYSSNIQRPQAFENWRKSQLSISPEYSSNIQRPQASKNWRKTQLSISSEYSTNPQRPRAFENWRK